MVIQSISGFLEDKEESDIVFLGLRRLLWTEEKN